MGDNFNYTRSVKNGHHRYYQDLSTLKITWCLMPTFEIIDILILFDKSGFNEFGKE